MSEPLDQPNLPDSADDTGAFEFGRGDMPFLEHVEELRRRLLKSFLAVVVMAIIAFYFADQIIWVIKEPLGGTPLHNMQVTGVFYAYLKIALITGVIGALPIIFYQMWMFISPGLMQQEKMIIVPLVIISTILFLIGATFCYLMVLPIALKFLLGFGGDLITNYITIDSYISFAGLLLLAFGFAFQLPVVAFILGKIGLITSSMLAKGRRYAIIVILVVGAIITPPDIFTQVLLAGPIYLLYEISIIVVYFTGRKRVTDESEESPVE